jgi:hypothetical protein
MIRFEILLPLFYNDGRPIEPEKFVTTDDELVRHFSATATDTVIVHGKWLYQSTLYSDKLVRIRIDVSDDEENRARMRQIKETLKSRFDQLDIWITAHEIEII